MSVSNRQAGVCLMVAAIVAIALVVASCAQPLPASAPSGNYAHFFFTAGECGESSPIGQGVIDLRNGNEWCVPHDGSAPIFQGTLNLGAIPEKAPARADGD
jgi:hypothetical protein